MSNPLRKTMVYLGLADEEVQYDHGASAHAPSAAPVTNAGSGQRAPVTPLRRPAASRAAAPSSDMNEILTVHPRHYKDAQVIAESFREGIPVIMNLTQMSEPEARRLVVHGFLVEVVQKIGNAALQERLLAAIEAELAQIEVI